MNKQKHTRLLLLSVIFLFLLFAFVAVVFPNNSLDMMISQSLQNMKDASLTQIMIFISIFGEPEILFAWTIGMIIVFTITKHTIEAKYTALTLLAYPISVLLKNTFHRPRPYLFHVSQLGMPLSDPSFPSGHVFIYTVFFGMLIVTLVHTKALPTILRFYLIFLSSLLITFIPLSRVYLGSHWFTDTLGGYCAGIFFLLILYHYYWKERVEYHHTLHRKSSKSVFHTLQY